MPMRIVESPVEPPDLLPREPGQRIPPAKSETAYTKEADINIPYTGFHGIRLLHDVDPGQHQRDVREQQRDARDVMRLRVEKLALIVGVLGIAGLLFTLSETRRQADIADKAHKAAQRASVSLGLSDGKFIDFVALGSQLRVVLYFRNYGGTTARNTNIDIRAAVTTPTATGAVVTFPPVPRGRFPIEVGPDIPPDFQHTEYLTPSANFREIIDAGQAAVTLIGRLSYADEFGSYCHTFAAFYKPEINSFRLRAARDELCDGNAHSFLFCHYGWDAEITSRLEPECREEGPRLKVK